MDNRTREAIALEARRTGIEPEALMAVAMVESAGVAFADLGGRREPLIRFEGHYFDRRLAGAALEAARRAGLASPQAGAVRNPAAQAARWRLLDAAAAIDRRAAFESTSWGLGQVMGAHWAWLGLASVDAMVAEARSGAAGQARLMAAYIVRAGLAGALAARDWEAFARGYNGPGFRANGYHLRIADAYRRLAGGGGAAELLRRGARGEAVADLQRRLSALGHRLADDGIFGPLTEAAVRAFQAAHGLVPDGLVGRLTVAALEAAEAATHSLLHRFLHWLHSWT